MIEIREDLAIPDDEVTFAFSRSGGPGGQNVNKVATRVTLLFDVAGSRALSPDQKARILDRLRTRVSRAGVLRVVSQATRSQSANRAASVERFAALLRGALASARPRTATTAPPAERARRLDAKHRRGLVKRGRRPPVDSD